jgi:hypothetical protein
MAPAPLLRANRAMASASDVLWDGIGYLLSRNRTTCGVPLYVWATCKSDVDSWVVPFIAWWIDQETGYPLAERAGVLSWFVRVNDTPYWADQPQDLAMHVDPEGEPIPPKSVTFIPAKLTDNVALMRADPADGFLAQGSHSRDRNRKHHLAICLDGPRLSGCGRLASIRSAMSSIDHRRSLIPAAMAGVTFSVLWMRMKL